MLAKCLCGQLQVEVNYEIKKTSICHCVACQRRTGSAFGFQAAVPKAKIKVVGDYSTYRRVPEEGGWVDSHFCATCGSTVFYEIDDFPNDMGIALGTLADYDFSFKELPAPCFSVYKDHKLKWVEIPPSVTEDWD